MLEPTMAQLNDNYLKLKAGYLFPEIGRRVKAFCDANPEGAKQHQREIRGRTREGHQGGAMRVATRPAWIIRSAGKANHAAEEKEAQNWENNHPIR